MSNAYRWTVTALIVLVVPSLLGSPNELRGQSRESVPTFLVIPESFPDVDGRVVLLREPGRDIVLLRESDASPETLSVALTLLGRLNASTPRREGQGQMVPVTGYVLRSPLADERRATLEEALGRLRRRPLARVGNLGVGRSIPFRDGDD